VSELEERGYSGRQVEIPAGVRPKALWPSPRTLVAGVVGFPVRHSLSPRLQNAAFGAMGLDWCYLAFEVPPGSLERAVSGAAALGLRGLSVTMPHKDAAARLATRHSRQVRRLGAAGGRGLRPGWPALRRHRCRRRRQGGCARPGGGWRCGDRRRQQDRHASLEVGRAGTACGSRRPPGGAEGNGPRGAGHTDGHARYRSLKGVFSSPHGGLDRL
jgi:hypothetical protein